MNTKIAVASKPSAKKTPRQPVVRKPAPKAFHEPAEREPDLDPVPETAVQLIALQLLGRAPENVRHTRANEDILELADDIAAHGLLQSLIGYQDDTDTIFPAGYTWIVGGGRRLQALELLRDRGAIPGDYRVPVLVRPMEEAVELSLSENLARRNMNPVDEFEAFATLMKPGTLSTADLAKRFGFPERYVKQRLRLATLADVVLDALREREITLDAAMAYASTQDTRLQAEVFKKQSKSPYDSHGPASIRRDLNSKAVTTGNPLFKFVGEIAYRAAGGGFEDDLFNEIGKERTLTKPFLLTDLVREKIASERNKRFPELVAATPSLAGWIEVPELRVFSWGASVKPKAPTGFALVDKWEFEPVWKTIRNNGIPAYVAVGIDEQGELAVCWRIAFVAEDQLEAVIGKPAAHAPSPIRSAADWAAERRENEVQHIQWQLAARAVLGPDWGHDEIIYPRDDSYPDAVSDPQRPDLAHGKLVAVQVFVTDDQFTAQRDAAVAEQASTADRIAAVRAMKPEPAVIVVDYVAFYRWENGSYQDVPEDSGKTPDRLIAADSLDGLLDEAGNIGRVCATIAEYTGELEHEGAAA